ncbi:dCTP deaminase domain-containing protein [Leclercia adecarboxylata]|uniref:dCTP deaminase n=1 Tax=Leclercia adecarboxylata TaxID=83655 RepID=UPI00384C2AF2
MPVYSNIKILQEIKSNNLITNHDLSNLGPASYELRMGQCYYDLNEGDNPIQLTQNQDVIIKPGHLVVLITKEKLNIPNNIVGRVISKGSLFSVGLTPVCTNADPGFSGNLGIVTHNISDKYIVIPQNESIAKIDFSELESPSTKPYVGQHGFHTNVWPIKKQFQKNHSDVENDPRVKKEEVEAHKIIPKYVSLSIRKCIRYQKIASFLLLCLMALNVFLIAAIDKSWLTTTVSFGISVIASIFVLILTTFMDRVFKI